MFGAIKELESAVRKLKKSQYDAIRVGCSRVPSARLVPIAVAIFKRKYADIEISIKTGRSHEVESWIADHGVDLGIIEGDPENQLISKEPAYADELLLVLSPHAVLAGFHRTASFKHRARLFSLIAQRPSISVGRAGPG